MFTKGQLIIYGNSGVYRVKDIGRIDIPGADRDYYTLEPLDGRGVSYIPVDSKVFLRPVMTESEANSLIDSIPAIDGKPFSDRSPKALKEHYSESMKSHDCTRLLGMIKEIYEKSRSSRKLSRIDQQYMSQAEELLYSEFAVALGIPRDEVREYIRSRLGNRG